MSNDDARKAYMLSDELRVWLRRRHERPAIITSALVYELASLIALGAQSLPDAENLIDEWTDVMKEQVRRLGVGVEHP